MYAYTDTKSKPHCAFTHSGTIANKNIISLFIFIPVFCRIEPSLECLPGYVLTPLGC